MDSGNRQCKWCGTEEPEPEVCPDCWEHIHDMKYWHPEEQCCIECADDRLLARGAGQRPKMCDPAKTLKEQTDARQKT